MARPARPDGAELARRLVERLGGRFSVEAGIDVDEGAHEAERWFLAATLFGTRISAAVAVRTYRVLDAAGVSTIADAGGIARFGFEARDPDTLVGALDELPGWGPTTVGAFVRELRGVWPAAAVPLDPRAERAARHLRLGAHAGRATWPAVARLAAEAGLDGRDLEAALVRLALAHERAFERCEADGRPCPVVFREGGSPQQSHR